MSAPIKIHHQPLQTCIRSVLVASAERTSSFQAQLRCAGFNFVPDRSPVGPVNVCLGEQRHQGQLVHIFGQSSLGTHAKFDPYPYIGEVGIRQRSRRNVWRNSKAANKGSPDFDSNLGMPKSDVDSCQSDNQAGRTVDLGNGSVHHSLAAVHSSDESWTGFGNESVAASKPVIQSSDGTFKSSASLANALSAFHVIDDSPNGSVRGWIHRVETGIERAIFDFRFLSLLAIGGSLLGSFLCFIKGCVYIAESYVTFYTTCLNGTHSGQMVLRLVEAVDVYLVGTVMLIFGMGLYGLFISNVPRNLPPSDDRALQNSSLFGMFILKDRPKWMQIGSLDELKTKLGHVIVMILLVKMFERSKTVTITTGADLLSYSISIFLSSASLLVLHKLHH